MKLTKTAILSISTLTILMNAAIVPLLSSISAAFPDASPTLIKMSLSLPALVSILFSLLTGLLARFIPKKILLAVGLILYSLGGIGAGFMNSIQGFLALRAVLGAGSGVIAPLASDFVADFYEGDLRARMIGYANSAANITGVFLPLLAASLALANWRFSFGVYSLGLVVLVLTWFYIPFKKALVSPSHEQQPVYNFSKAALGPAFSIFFLVLLFYAIPSNLSVFVKNEGIGSPSIAALVISISTLASTIFNFAFARIYIKLKDWILPVGFFLCGLGFFAVAGISSLITLIVGEILIGIALGLLFPYFPLKIMENTTPEETTGALSVLSGAFSIGMFLSPIFFLGASSLLKITHIRGEFTLAAILFCIGTLVAGILQLKKKQSQMV
jgi:MFS family permease